MATKQGWEGCCDSDERRADKCYFFATASPQTLMHVLRNHRFGVTNVSSRPKISEFKLGAAGQTRGQTGSNRSRSDDFERRLTSVSFCNCKSTNANTHVEKP